MESDPSKVMKHWSLQNKAQDCALGMALFNTTNTVQIYLLSSATQPHRINAYTNPDGLAIRVDQIIGSNRIETAREIWVNLINAGWSVIDSTDYSKYGAASNA